MERIRVVSSNIVSVGYNENSLILEIEFKQGKIYQYEDVPIAVYENLMAADSAGQYYRENIMNKYRWPS